MIYILLIIFLLIIYKIFEYSVRLEGTVKVLLLFSLFAFVYYMAIPIEFTIKGTSIGAYGLVISERVKQIVISIGILAIVGFAAGYLISSYNFNITKLSIDIFDPIVLSVAVLAIVSGIMLFGVFYDSILNSISSYAGNFTETYVNPVYAYLKEIFTYSLAILIVFLTNAKGNMKLLALLPTAALIVFGLISSDKDPILLSVLGWGILFFFKLSQIHLIEKIRTYFLILVLGSIIIPAFSLAFSMYRADALDETFKQVKKNGLYTYFDAAGPFESLVDVIGDPNTEFEYGKTYYWSLIGWIPKSIWPNRPLDLATSYAKEKIKNWQPGYGLGYSLLTEAYKNFGIPGALLQYFMIGIMLGLLGKLSFWLFKNKLESKYIFFIWLSYNLAIMHRGPLNLPSSFIRFILPFLLCYWSLWTLLKLYNRWRVKRIN